MLESPRGLRAIVLAAVVLCIVASLTGARAGEPSAAGLKIAVINPEEAVSQYKLTQDAEASLATKKTKLETEVRVWSQGFLLTADEQTKLSDLAIKQNAAPNKALDAADAAQQKTLTDKQQKSQDDYQALAQKQGGQLTQAEIDALKGFTKAEADSKTRIQEWEASQEKLLGAEADKARAQVDQDVRASINKVSKKEGYNLVFSSGVVLYCENDITKLVVDDLNKNFKPASGG